MRARNAMFWAAAVVLTLAAAATTPAFPQGATPGASAPEQQGQAPSSETQKEGQQTVETILRQQEELLSGQRFSYDPGGRRDPFRSLTDEISARKKGPRPRGVAGMLVSEIDLTGIVRDAQGGNVAVFIGSDNKGYFLRAGDEVYDGTVLAIDPASGSVTFRQQVDDPRLIKPYRDVVKRLTPVDVEEEKANE
ncbi:MAG TPA: hypothetical protein VF139_09395 [Candidatus Polarisedimenticolaceae bacterium]